MHKYLATCLCALFLTACAGTTESESLAPADPEHIAVAQEPMAAEPEVAQKTKNQKEKKGKKEKTRHAVKKSESQIREELNATARTIVTRASRTITPSKTSKAVKSSSHGYVASYVHIDPANYSVDMRPASKAGQYVGFVRYTEQIYHCNGKTRSEALKAPCSPVQSRRLNEMIHYDGVKWSY
ncbi:MAG: translation initiation factor 2 [Desulfovibrionaceae bacterium]|nr:translation initiation factor 2 [Desulfovibrionaceae bacterium]